MNGKVIKTIRFWHTYLLDCCALVPTNFGAPFDDFHPKPSLERVHVSVIQIYGAIALSSHMYDPTPIYCLPYSPVRASCYGSH
jgi:hypothetical protein